MKFMQEISLRDKMIRLFTAFLFALTLAACGGGGGSSGASSGSAAAALFFTAPSSVIIANGATSTYAIGGGSAPYTVSSSNVSVASATVSGATLTISGVANGTATVTVFDAAGKSVTTNVSIGSGGTALPLYMTAPSGGVTIAVGATATYTVGGGTGFYTVSSGNASVGTASVSGATLTIKGVATGTTQITVFDSTGAAVTTTATIGSAAAINPLYMTAPSAVTVGVGKSSAYTIGGGTAPYTVSSSNTDVATATVSGTTLNIAGVIAGTVQISVFDVTGRSVSTSATVSNGTVATSLYVAAPSAITLAVGAAPSYVVGGGTAPYDVSSSDTGVATASVTGTRLTITGVAAGKAQVSVFDKTGATMQISVTVGSGGAATLYITAPATINSSPGTASTFSIGGGAAPYIVSTSNPGVATAGVSGSTLTITGLTAGTAQISVFDAAGKSVSTSVTVGSGVTALFSTAPGAVTTAAGTTLNYAVSGGTAPYAIASSNPAVAGATVDSDGAHFTISALTVGSAQISVLDAAGASVKVSVTVGGSGLALSTTAPSSITIAVGGAPVSYTISGGTAPYSVTSSNASVAATTGSSGAALVINGVAGGVATVLVHDAVNATVSLSVNVGSSNALFTTAPGAVTLTVGTAPTYSVSGGTAPYTVASSNTSAAVANMVGGNTLSVAGVAVGSAQVVVFDSTGKSVTVNVTVVVAGSGTPLFTTAPAAGVTIGTGGSEAYTIGGGSPGYSASSSNTSVATTNVVGTTLTINGVAGGTATVVVRDGAGTTVSLTVNVGSANALFTAAPSDVTIAVSATPTYSIGGGTAPYTVSSSNTAVAVANVSGSTLSIAGTAAGTAKVVVFDTTGKFVTINVTVGSGGSAIALYTTAPSALTLNMGGARTFTIGGGTGPYTVTSSNTLVANTSLAADGTSMTITGMSGGTAQVNVLDSKAVLVAISVTVTGAAAPGPLFTTAPAAVTLATGTTSNFTIGGGTPPYTVSSSNTTVAAASGFGSMLSITGAAAGSTSAVVTDAIGGKVTIAVTVLPVASTPLVVTPSTTTASVGDVLNFSISGGSPTYSVAVNNLSIGTATPISGIVSGGTFSVTLLKVGSTSIAVTDALGQIVTLNLTVNAATATLRLSPSALEVGEDNSATIALSIYGGTAPYHAFTSDLGLSSVTITGTTLNVATGTNLTRCITPVTSGGVYIISGSYNVTLTVVDSLGSSAISVLTIRDNGRGATPSGC